MKVTDVRLRKIQTDGRMKALVSITLDEAFVIHDLRVDAVMKVYDETDEVVPDKNATSEDSEEA
ncbi:septation protein SpoVG family protein [Staphylococcus aureus]